MSQIKLDMREGYLILGGKIIVVVENTLVAIRQFPVKPLYEATEFNS